MAAVLRLRLQMPAIPVVCRDWTSGVRPVRTGVDPLYVLPPGRSAWRPREGAGRIVQPARLGSCPTMNERECGEVTTLLRAWSDGEADAFDRVLPLVYEELHRMAARYLVGERSTVSLQATALVNELCLRLLGWDPVRWQNRGHFFGVSARMMRRVLVDIARRRRAERRGGPNAVRVPLDDDRRAGERAGRRPARGRRGARAARGRGPAQGPGRGASLLRRSLDRGDRGGARGLGAHGPLGLGVRPGVAVPHR